MIPSIKGVFKNLNSCPIEGDFPTPTHSLEFSSLGNAQNLYVQNTDVLNNMGQQTTWLWTYRLLTSDGNFKTNQLDMFWYSYFNISNRFFIGSLSSTNYLPVFTIFSDSGNSTDAITYKWDKPLTYNTTWNDLVIMYDSTLPNNRLKVYNNGEEITLTQVSEPVGGVKDLHWNQYNQHLIGKNRFQSKSASMKVARFGLWNEVKDENFASCLWNGGIFRKPSNVSNDSSLQMWLDFNDDKTTYKVIDDESGNGHHWSMEKYSSSTAAQGGSGKFQPI